NATPAFSRFCSGNLVWQEAGFDRPVYFCGEETAGTNTFDGQGGSLAAIFDNELHVLTKTPHINWENAVVRPQSGPLTVMMCLEDGPEGPESQLLMYVGVKDRRSGASPLRRNGLDNGQLFVFVAESQTRSNEAVFQTGSLRGHWELVPDAASLNDVELDEAEKAVGA